MYNESYTLRARRILTLEPGAPAISDGAVIVRNGVIAEVGTWRDIKPGAPAEIRDLGENTITPGLINAHTHLELSHLGLPPRPGDGYLAWVRWLITQPLDALSHDSFAQALSQLAGCETAGVADISSRKGAFVSQRLDEAGLEYMIQHERFGYWRDDSFPDVPAKRLCLAGHSLYSTPPETLRAAKQWDSARCKHFSIHLAEHEGEVELCLSGTGAFADFMRQRILPPDFRPPGLSPVAWADRLGLLDAGTLAVHAVHLSDADREILLQQRVTVCLCPRSNKIIGVGRAPAEKLLEAGVPCCLGTDSLASAPDLNLWEELRELLGRTHLGLTEAVSMLTAVPARVLGFRRLGSLSPGKAFRIARLPKDIEAELHD